MKRRVHFIQPPLREAPKTACGRAATFPVVVTWRPGQVTCRRQCATVAALALAVEQELLARIGGAHLVFLDFDGVLNHLAFFQSRPKRATPRTAADAWTDRQSFDRSCVARLNDLCARTGALVVVSSSWRASSSVAAMQALLDGYGFTGTVVGLTPEMGERPRGEVILAFLAMLPVPPCRYIVLDDDAGEESEGRAAGWWMAGVLDRLVHTSFEHGGLTDEKAAEALAMLGCGR